MAKLVFRGDVYDSVSPQSLFEADYERLLLANGTALYPGFQLLRFKIAVPSEYGNARADLALVHSSYRKWWVVEVELAGHSLWNHVEPQVRILSSGAYGPEHSEYLAAQSPKLDPVALADMVRGEQPRVLVLVNQARPEWESALTRWGARLGIVEVFRSARGVDALSLDGEHPGELEDLVTTCRVDPLLPNMLIVDSPAALEIRERSTLTLIYGGGQTLWRRIDASNRVWLQPVHRCPIPKHERFLVIVRDSQNQLCLVSAPRRKEPR